jgi:hypothetical protein
MNRLFFNLSARCTMLAAAAAALVLGVSSTQGQSLLLEPDFSGMFWTSDQDPPPVMRDRARGWTYFAGGIVEGVDLNQWLFRINDAGLVDTQWRLPPDFRTNGQYLAPDGSPIVRAFVASSPTYEVRWYRLQRESVGLVTPVEISSASDLPPRDSVDLQQHDGSEAWLLPQNDGTKIGFGSTSGPAPAYTPIYTLRKLRDDGREQWSHVVDGRVHNLATDALGNVYLLGEALTIGGKTANLIRVRADGRADASWNPTIDITKYVNSTVRVVADRIVIANHISGRAPVNRLSTFDLVDGRTLGQRPLQYRVGCIADDGSALSAHADGRWAVLDTTRNDAGGDQLSLVRVGSFGYQRASVPWRGGYVVGGNFLYWFDGRLYRNLMRVDASFRPDPSWMPTVDDAVYAMATDRQGRLIVASNSATHQQARIQRFNADGALDSTWQAQVKGDVYTLLAASDGMLFVGGAFSAVNNVPRNSLARFSADGSLDLDWASRPSWPMLQPGSAGFGSDGIARIFDAGSDGVFFVWIDAYMNGSEAGLERLARDGTGAQLPVPAALAAEPAYAAGGGRLMRDPANGAIYAIVSAWELSSGAERGSALVRINSPNLTIDAAWTTFAGEYGRQFTDFAHQTDSHVYVCRGSIDTKLRRVDKATGREDPNWSSNESYLCGASMVERRDNGVTVIASVPHGSLRQFSTTAINKPSAVIEYYAREAKRFFMTARADEQAALNARPDAFVATGMQFAVEEAKVFSTDPTRVPVCRFYAPPVAGGSNSHFFGSGSDCVALKRFASLRYEGLDFRAGTAVAGSCPATLPQPVYRLFNSVGNHRYVVSEARRNEMRAAGWLDEGVAFCSSSTQDSRPLTALTQ